MQLELFREVLVDPERIDLHLVEGFPGDRHSLLWRCTPVSVGWDVHPQVLEDVSTDEGVGELGLSHLDLWKGVGEVNLPLHVHSDIVLCLGA